MNDRTKEGSVRNSAGGDLEKRIDERIDILIQEMVKEIGQAIRIPSVQGPAEAGAPFGREVARALEFALSSGEKKGFVVKNVDNYAGHIEFGSSGRLYAALGHLDVVPVEKGGADWSVPPFDGTVKDGAIWGRGASDDKGPTFAALYALYALKLLGVEPKNRIRVILGTNEETDWGCVQHYFQKEAYPDFAIVPDSVFPGVFAEKGILRLDMRAPLCPAGPTDPTPIVSNRILIEGGTAPNVVPKETRLRVISRNPEMIDQMLRNFRPGNQATLTWTRNPTGEFEILFTGAPFHAARPEGGINSIAACLDFCRSLGLAPLLKERLNRLWDAIGYDYSGKNAGISGQDGLSGALTLNLGTIACDERELRVTLDIRYPVFFDKGRVFKQIESAFRDFSIQESGSLAPLYVDPKGQRMRQLLRIYEDFTGEAAPPKAIGGGTYARAVPLGVSYGALFPGEESYAHRANERKSIASLTRACKIYARVFYEWLTES